jgi:hypothetical protein
MDFITNAHLELPKWANDSTRRNSVAIKQRSSHRRPMPNLPNHGKLILRILNTEFN